MTGVSRRRRRTLVVLIAVLVVVLAPAMGGAVHGFEASPTTVTAPVNTTQIADNLTNVSNNKTVGANVTVGPGNNTTGNGTGPPNETKAAGPPNGTVAAGPPNGTDGPGASGSNAQSGANAAPVDDPWENPPTGNATVNVTVENARANATVPVDVPAAPDAAVVFDSLDVEVKKDGPFTLNLSTAPTPREAPGLNRTNATVPLGYVHIEHSIADEDVGNVTITFRVNESLVAAANATPENVALFRFSEGNWTELPTELVGQDDGVYVYEAESPGLSEFATGAKRPEFKIPMATVSVTSVTVGEAVEVQVQITNVGSADGVYVAELSLDGAVVDEREVTVAAGGNRLVTFQRTLDQPGTYEVSVNEVAAGEVLVQSGTTTVPPPGDDPSTTVPGTTGPADGQPGFGPLVGVVAFLLWTVLVRRS